jgi:hypothetical protein
MNKSDMCKIESSLKPKFTASISGIIAGFCLVSSLAPNASAQNLVNNGTFDTNLSGWNIITIAEIVGFDWDTFGNPGGSARGDEVFGPGSGVESRVLGQFIPTVIGEKYDVTFQLYGPGSGNVNASFGSNSINVVGSQQWVSYLFEGVATTDSTIFAISYSAVNSPSIYIDNVSIRASNGSNVPGPLPLLGVGAAFGYSRKLRKRIKTRKSPEVLSAIG